MRTLLPLLVSVLLLVPGCEDRPSPVGTTEVKTVPQPPPPRVLLTEATKPLLVEVAAEALPAWRATRDLQPSLVVLSNAPLFAPVPAPLQDRARQLVEAASRAEIWAQTPFTTADPVFMPEMGIRSALKVGFFSELVWMLPIAPEDRSNLTPETLRSTLTEMQAFSEEEIASLEQTESGYAGRIEGKPLRIGFLDTPLAAANGVVLHLDLDYFVPLYRNEIKTPLFPLIHETLQQIKAQDWPTYTVSIARANFGEQLPLTVRFLGPMVSSFLSDPALLEGELSEVDLLRREILYLENFFQPEKTLENARKMVALAAEDPSAHFDLYRALLLNKQYSEAEEALNDAVRRDPAYALEYLTLAQKAADKGRHAMMADYLGKAAAAQPANPFIRLQQAQSLALARRPQEAEDILADLRKLTWSQTYYPGIDEQLGIAIE